MAGFSVMFLGGEACRRARRLIVAALVFVSAVAASPTVAAVFSPKTFTLANGLQVVVIESHRVPVVRHMVIYRVGAADDPPGKSGLAHYLEHLMFKGTTSIKPGEFSKIVARNGGRGNALTSADITAYYQTISKDRLELMMKIEADRMANLLITAKEAAPELQVVIEERRTRTDNRPAAQLNEHVGAALFMNHPYRIPIIGWRHEIDTLTVDDARAFYKRHYAPNNAILILAGDITVEEARPLAEKYYGVIPANPAIKPRVRLQEPPQLAPRRVTLTSDRVFEPQLTRDYLAPSRMTGEGKHADALEILTVIMGSGATSRLHRSLVLERKLALAVGNSYDGDVFGPASYGFIVRPRKGVSVAAVEAALDEEIKTLLADGVTEEELATAKKQAQSQAIFARDGLRRAVMTIGTTLANGRPLSDIEDWPARVDALTRGQILDAARHVFRIERSVTGLLLPEKSGTEGNESGTRERARTSRSSSEGNR